MSGNPIELISGIVCTPILFSSLLIVIYKQPSQYKFIIMLLIALWIQLAHILQPVLTYN
jgi:hypothetical protein